MAENRFIIKNGAVIEGIPSGATTLEINGPSSELLKIRRTDVFDFVQYNVGSVWTDITNEAGISIGAVSGDILNVIGDKFVVGKIDKFSNIYINVGTLLGGTIGEPLVIDWEYSTGGDTWSVLPVSDGTNLTYPLTQQGVVSFIPPVDWVTDSQNSSSQLYFVRLRVVSGTFSTEPTVYLVTPNDGQPVAEIYANGNDIVPAFAITRSGQIISGIDPGLSFGSHRLYVNGTSYLGGALTISGALAGATSGAFSGTITSTLTGSGQSHPISFRALGPSATSLLPSQNSSVTQWAGSAWNGFISKLNSMDIYVNPDSEAITRSRMAFKNSVVDGTTDISELMNITSDGTLNVLGRAQPTDQVFDAVLAMNTGVYTNITNSVSDFRLLSGDVLNVIGDSLYFGKREVFSGIQIVIGTAKSAGGVFEWEYFASDDTWKTLTVTDGSVNGASGPLSQSGNVDITVPVDWKMTTAGSTTAQVGPLYYVRLRVVSSAFSVEPTLNWALPDNSTVLTGEILNDSTFDQGATYWQANGDYAYSTNDFTYTYNTGAGNLTQLSTNFKNPIKPNTWYRFRISVGVIAPTTSNTVAWIGPEVALDNTYFQVSSTTEIDCFFKSNSNPGNFVIYTTATATSGMRLDGASLTECAKGDILATGNIMSKSLLVSDNIGIGTTTPNSTLQIAGSLSLPYVEKTSGYTLTELDYTVNCTANSFTVILPTAVGITGRIYNIKNTGAGTITVDANSTELIDGLETQSVTTGVNLQIQSTGTGWIIL